MQPSQQSVFPLHLTYPKAGASVFPWTRKIKQQSNEVQQTGQIIGVEELVYVFFLHYLRIFDGLI